MLVLGKIRLNYGLIMAPLSGTSNIFFRLLMKKLGAELVYSEMVSSNGIVRKQPKTFKYLKMAEEERPVVVQIFGAEPNTMLEAAKIAQDMGADAVDINMGCPVKKVVKTGAGAALLRDPSLAMRIISSVRAAVSVPVTVKTRLGLERERSKCLRLIESLRDMGVDALVVHGRSANETYESPARLDAIEEIRERAKIPVIPNGDIFGAQRAYELLKWSVWPAVMIGRGALKDPWIFSKARAMLDAEGFLSISRKGLGDAISWAAQRAMACVGEKETATYARRVILRCLKGFEGARELRARLGKGIEGESVDGLIKLLDRCLCLED